MSSPTSSRPPASDVKYSSYADSNATMTSMILPADVALDFDGDRKDGVSSASSTSHTTTSPTPFLTIAEQTFTPLSMSSDLLSDMDDATAYKPFQSLADVTAVLRQDAGMEMDQLPSVQGPSTTSPTQQHLRLPTANHEPRQEVHSTASCLHDQSDGMSYSHSPCILTGRAGVVASIKYGEKNITAETSAYSTDATSPTPRSVRGIQPGVNGCTGQPHSGSGSTIPAALAPAPSMQEQLIRSSTPARTHPNHHLDLNTSHRNVVLCPTPSLSSASLITLQLQQSRSIQGDDPSDPSLGPLVRRLSDKDALAIRQPAPDLKARSGASRGNIALLEATAEKLSTSSSIEDAIRELHSELKRSDSQRSSVIAAGINGSTVDKDPPADLAHSSLSRHLSTTSSIASLNHAARHGGYSPGEYIVSPSHSLRNRFGSSSKASSSRFDMEFEGYLSRSSPGKGSIRSVHSRTLAEIAESDPITLTQDVLDEADRTPLAEDDDETIRPPREPSVNALDIDAIHTTVNENALEPSAHGLSLEDPNALDVSGGNGRQITASPARDYEPGENAFGDFDGVHWEPDLSLLPSPRLASPIGGVSIARPKSYLDPDTGQQMMYYPARVPMMLNLPPKLSKQSKAAARNDRQSRILSTMQEASRQSAPWLSQPVSEPASDEPRQSWLPDPLDGQFDSPFLPLSNEYSLKLAPQSPKIEVCPPLDPDQQGDTGHPVREERLSTQSDPVLPAIPRPRPRDSRQIDGETRKSRVSRLDNIPPQLRASVFFDLPSAIPKLDVKDGSAMSTLNDLLDASAKAPVSAFTDHAYAGKLGNEVYGIEKKRNSVMPKRPTSAGFDSKKRRSIFPWGRRNTHAVDDDQRNTPSGRLSPDKSDGGSQTDADGGPMSSQDTQELHDLGGEMEETEEGGYQGAPTTLLAELQLRKQEQKMRTRPINRTYPNGTHSTLLELDAVAEKQQSNRKGKRVNLAWEEPVAVRDDAESDDEDVPLGVLLAVKAAGSNNIGVAATADPNRPLGLMERRDMEDNEPLSYRRARLKGFDPHQITLAKRRTMATLAGPMMTSSTLYQPPSVSQTGTEDVLEEEVEDESLAERIRRLKGSDEHENPLPRARPVSAAFSAELLSQFGDLEDDKDKGAKANEIAKAKDKVARHEDVEETLGQRRRRLQAERESRERKISPVAPKPVTSTLPHRLSMADILSAHPFKESLSQPEEHHRMREEDRMSKLRAQMPTISSTATLNHPSAFMGGLYNDGTGGTGIRRVPSPQLSGGGLGPDLPNRTSIGFSGHRPLTQHTSVNGMTMGYQVNATAYPSIATAAAYGSSPAQMPATQGQADMVERWRHGVMP